MCGDLMEKLTMTIPEMAKQLNVSKPTAYAIANTKGFPVLQLGRRKVVPVDGFKQWMERNAGQRF